MRPRRQKIQLELALVSAAKGEARSVGRQGTEVCIARRARTPCGRAGTVDGGGDPARQFAEGAGACPPQQGVPSIDDVTVDDLDDHLKSHWPEITSRLLDGAYTPKPVRRLQIPKASGGIRPLGVPTVLDRFIQQAVMQVLQGDLGSHPLRREPRVLARTLSPSSGQVRAGSYQRGLRYRGRS